MQKGNPKSISTSLNNKCGQQALLFGINLNHYPMKVKSGILILLMQAILQLHAQTIIYVDSANTSGTQDGTTWSTAYNNLQTALSNSISGNTLWVAKGTYQPSLNTSFAMKEGVKIYGGFVSGSSNFPSRDWKNNITILSGNGKRVIDNTFTNSSPMTSASVLDGFTITGGTGNKTGSGINNVFASPTLSNLIITNNQTSIGGGTNLGGGIYNNSSSPVITNVTISNNIANDGGGMYNSGGSPTLTNVIFSGNTSRLTNGGGMMNVSPGNPVLTNVYFYNNAALSGDGMFNSGASPVLTNVVFDSNHPTALNGTAYSGGIYNASAASPLLVNVTFYNNSGYTSGAIYNNGNTTNPVLENVVFYGNTSVIGEADVYSINSASPSVSYSYTQTSISGIGNILGASNPFSNSSNTAGSDGIFMTFDDGLNIKLSSGAFNNGNNSDVPSGTFTDIAGSVRIQDDIVDMGAYEFSGTILSTNLLSFSGSLQNGMANLQWQTNEEDGINHFEIEKSLDAQTYTTASSIPAKGNNSNYFLSIMQREDKAFYRLKVIDNDGHFSFGNIVQLIQHVGNDYQLYPNPAKDYIHINATKAETINIYDAIGRLVKKQKADIGINIIDVSNLSVGIYFCDFNEMVMPFIKQ